MENLEAQKSKFIYQIEAEVHLPIVIRVLGAFTRRRIKILEIIISSKDGDDRQRLMLMVHETRSTAVKISKKLENEIDILKVELFENNFNF